MEYKPVEELEVVWEAPPAPPLFRSPSHYRAAVLEKFQRELLAHRERWAVLPVEGLRNEGYTETTARAAARNINKRQGSWEEGDFPWEAKAVGTTVYVRAREV